MQLNNIPDNAVVLKGDHPVTSSLRVAEIFGKQHLHVLEKIRALTADCPAEFNQSNFRLVEFLDAKGEIRPAYELTRNGFALLVMGFTGPKALAFKIAFIERFDAMEAALHNGRNLPAVIPAVLALGEYLAARDHLRDLQAELDVLFGQFKAAKIEVTHDEIEAMREPYLPISNHLVRTRDLVAMTDAHGVPRKAVEELLGINNNNLRQHALKARKPDNPVTAGVDRTTSGAIGQP
jgi:Rha family phage regulatory protein